MGWATLNIGVFVVRFKSLALMLGIALAMSAVAAVPAASGTAVKVQTPASRADSVLAVGGYHACAILRTGDVKCWGYNSDGELGQGDDINRGDMADQMGANLPVVDLGTGRTAVAISGGTYQSCAILDNGDTKCWGYNNHGQLGQGDNTHRGDDANEMGDNLPAINLGTGRTAIAISAGYFYSCAILDNDDTKCWGKNAQGQLGLGDTTNRGDTANQMGDNLPAINLGTGRTAVAISTAGRHACAILDNGDLKCWGDNDHGQLGLGDTTRRGDMANQMGDDLPTVDLGTGRTATAISNNYQHTCAILDNGNVKCWGNGKYGQLGQGDTANRGEAANQMGDDLPNIDLGTGRTATAISTGSYHSCALLDNGDLKCWGYNSEGNLGLGDTTHRGEAANQMGDDLPAIDLGTGRTVITIAAETSGYGLNCVLLDDETVKCWGDNSDGQLALGNTTDWGGMADQMGDDLAVVDLDGRVRPIQVDCPTSPVHTFTDVSDTSFADDDVTCIKALAITTGTGDGTTYSPGDSATREQMAAFIARVWRTLDQTCPTTPAHGFTDVSASSYANDDITCIKALGITTGTTDTTYSPNNPVTREQMAAFLARLWRALGNTCPTTPAHGFTDVPAGSYANDDITCIKALGITTGTSNTTYSPGDPVTREQIAAFIGRLIYANINAT